MFPWDSIIGVGKALFNAGSKGITGLVSSFQPNVAGTTQAVGPAYGTFEYWKNQGMASTPPINYSYKTAEGSSTKTDTSYLGSSVESFFKGFLTDAQQALSSKLFGTSVKPVTIDKQVNTSKPVVVQSGSPAQIDPLTRFFQGLIGVQPAQPSETTIVTKAPNYLPLILGGAGVVALVVLVSKGRK